MTESTQVEFDEAERIFEELLQRTEAGEDVVITRGGVPVARLRPHG